MTRAPVNSFTVTSIPNLKAPPSADTALGSSEPLAANDSSRFAGRAVIVSRPAGQEQRLCRLLAAAGAEPLHYPAITLLDPPNPAELRERLTDLRGFDLAIFISANAVNRALALLDQRPPPGLRLAVIGKASRAALNRHRLDADLMPERGFDSEALLALPSLQRLAGRRIAIFRGSGGRGLLGDTLAQRGADVHYFDVYQRIIPTLDATPLLTRWQAGERILVSATSNEGLQNLAQALGDRVWPWLRASPLAVLSQRAAELAAELGWEAPVAVAAEPSDAALVDCLAGLEADCDQETA